MSFDLIFLPKKFKNRVFFLITFLGISTLLINIVVTIIVQQQVIVRGVQKAAKSQFMITRKPLLTAILTDNLYEMLMLSKSVVDADPAIRNVFILDERFQYLTDANNTRTLPFRITDDLLDDKFAFDAEGFHYFRIKIDKRIMGYLVFEIDDQQIQSNLLDYTLLIFWISLPIISLGIFVGYKLSRVLTYPLETLSHAMDHANIKKLPITIPMSKFASEEIIQLHHSLEALSGRLKETVEQLYDKELMLVKNQKLASIGTMAAGLAHELKNPIMTIDLLTNKMQRKLKNTEHISDLDVVRMEAKRLVLRIDEFLEFAKTVKVDLQEISIEELMEQCQKSIDLHCGNKILLNVNYRKGKEKLFVDPEKFQQVLINLCNNSIEAGATKITFCHTFGYKYHRFLLIDNGSGFNNQDINQAFLPFFTTKTEGTGLGLSICEMITIAMKGGLFIETETEKGAKIIITFPRKHNGDHINS